MSAFLAAIDWGTTNRRIYLLDREGALLDTRQDDRGVRAMGGTGYAEAMEALRADHRVDRILLAGMVGSNIGWQTAPYVAAPAGLADLVAELHWVEPGRVAIVPGLRTAPSSAPDVMRGEEVQLLGAAAAGMVEGEGLLCQPGTHCKWAEIADGRITGFATSMTGELFALLRDHSLLSALLKADATPGPAFDEGVHDARARPLMDALFGIRAAWLLGAREEAEAASYASGLLIGADILAHVRGDVRGNARGEGRAFAILSDARLGGLYQAAAVALGLKARLADSETAFLAGIRAIAAAAFPA